MIAGLLMGVEAVPNVVVKLRRAGELCSIISTILWEKYATEDG